MNKAAAMRPQLDDVHADIANYYAAKISRFGPTPLGVDWTCVPTQELRFVQLARLIEPGNPFSLHDFGCGYGALVGFLSKRFGRANIDYLGLDLVPEMIAHARKKWKRHPGVQFEEGATPSRSADYAVASGIFNVKLYHASDRWHQHVANTLGAMARSSKTGFAVNFLAPLADHEAGREELYRPHPDVWIAHCRDKLGGTPTLVDNYGLREFTLLVRA
ncbi:MAG: class I SAM-dependent methyltransferase [Burkholderiales bacterium]|nr:class I SAM-dependent methyltransferase [Burkholderiales bacterium]